MEYLIVRFDNGIPAFLKQEYPHVEMTPTMDGATRFRNQQLALEFIQNAVRGIPGPLSHLAQSVYDKVRVNYSRRRHHPECNDSLAYAIYRSKIRARGDPVCRVG